MGGACGVLSHPDMIVSGFLRVSMAMLMWGQPPPAVQSSEARPDFPATEGKPRRPGTLRVPFHPLEHSAAALADCGVLFVLADVRGVIPAAVALGAVRFFDVNVHSTGPI